MSLAQPPFADGDRIYIYGSAGEPGIVARGYSAEGWHVVVSESGIPPRTYLSCGPVRTKGTIFVYVSGYAPCTPFESDWVLRIDRPGDGTFSPELVGGMKWHPGPPKTTPKEEDDNTKAIARIIKASERLIEDIAAKEAKRLADHKEAIAKTEQRVRDFVLSKIEEMISSIDEKGGLTSRSGTTSHIFRLPNEITLVDTDNSLSDAAIEKLNEELGESCLFEWRVSRKDFHVDIEFVRS